MIKCEHSIPWKWREKMNNKNKKENKLLFILSVSFISIVLRAQNTNCIQYISEILIQYILKRWANILRLFIWFSRERWIKHGKMWLLLWFYVGFRCNKRNFICKTKNNKKWNRTNNNNNQTITNQMCGFPLCGFFCDVF